MMKCLSYKSHPECPPHACTSLSHYYSNGGILSKYDVVDLWISVPETCSNMQKSCLQLRYVYSVIYMMVGEEEAADLST